MKKSRLNLPHIKLLIAHRIANGHSQRQIAQELGTSQPTISRIVRHDDFRELIRKEEKRLCQQIKEILEKIQNDARFLADYQKALEKKLLNSIRQL
ncbi:MAG: helix-turn-helix domain-containing protein [Deltaproteobacteria bacterium]|jgi:DNA-binding MarR family transcriptional regulator|nr:helix-turn-helix domain-containing protein [Deltaproteobacteria bacterium]